MICHFQCINLIIGKFKEHIGGFNKFLIHIEIRSSFFIKYAIVFTLVIILLVITFMKINNNFEYYSIDDSLSIIKGNILIMIYFFTNYKILYIL